MALCLQGNNTNTRFSDRFVLFSGFKPLLGCKAQGQRGWIQAVSLTYHPAMAAFPMPWVPHEVLASLREGCKRWEGEELLGKAAAVRSEQNAIGKKLRQAGIPMVQDQGLVYSAAATREQPGRPPVPSPWTQALPCWGLFCFPQLSVP